MPKILIVAATAFEIQPMLSWLTDTAQSAGPNTFQTGAVQVEIRVTGIGAVATSWHLARHGFAGIDMAINAGIAGALDRDLQMCEVVHVVSEQFGDLGIEQADGSFSDLFQSGLADPQQAPFTQGKLMNPGAAAAQFLPSVQGITVQKVHGFEPSIEKFRAVYPDAQVESMEGAAFFYACLQQQMPFVEVRSISNYVEKRDRSKWDISGAVNALNFTLIGMIEALAE